ncbi:MAG TPA: LptF/LptG family permease [Blastocatellia bacterium]|nr:LptF/LptG family permease [Blastocatellia bacterium]
MLRLIDRYLIREILPYVLLGLLLLTAIIFAQNASRFSEMLVVASRNGLPMEAISRLMAALVPGIMVFTLPISLLVGTLVGLGRLSGDSEIIALGASGISRFRILMPVVALALFISVVMVYVTFNLLPVSMYKLTDLKANQSLIFQGINTQIKPRVFEESLPKKVLYIEDIDRANNLWKNVFLVDLGDEQEDMKIMTATRGMLRQGERSDMPELYLSQISVHQLAETKSGSPTDQEHSDSEIAAEAATEAPPDRDRERKRNRNQQNYTLGRFDEMALGLEITDEKKAEAAGVQEEKREVQHMVWIDLINHSPAPEHLREWRAEIHKRIALPAACLVFALLGVAFGISNVRTGRSFGLLLGLTITVVYYLLALSGEHAALTGKLPVWLGIWLANIVLAGLAVFTILLQRRPGSDALSMLSSFRHSWPFRLRSSSPGKGEAVPVRLEADAPRSQGENPKPRIGRLPMPQLIDRLVLTDLTRFFFFILSGFSILFIIITLFQLLDYITRNNIDWSVVANYLFFLLPMIINYVTPLAALVAVMITFGILQKTSQVVALKASGQSIYRLAAPALIGSTLLSAFVFFNQDYILPFTNRRQNNLRYLIRKGQEPPQTFYQTTNQWIFGEESRIYNYQYFNITNNSFARLNVLDLSREPFGIKRRLYARRAVWDDATREWVLENGWERRFNDDRLVAYETFKERRVALAEGPDYFKKDSRGSSSLTLFELRRKIADLSQSGFDVLDLKIALQSKIAFPVTCLVMVVVGLPFAFSVGKRGALYGVSIGIAIGLLYWGLIGLFEQMGRYEMLPPLLAAWGPNMLFGAGGLYLFLTSRT